MRAVIDEKAIECDTMRKRLQEAAEAQMKTVDKDLAKNIVLKYLALPGQLWDCLYGLAYQCPYAKTFSSLE